MFRPLLLVEHLTGFLKRETQFVNVLATSLVHRALTNINTHKEKKRKKQLEEQKRGEKRGSHEVSEWQELPQCAAPHKEKKEKREKSAAFSPFFCCACVCVCVCGCRHRWACVYGGLCSFFLLFFLSLSLSELVHTMHTASRDNTTPIISFHQKRAYTPAWCPRSHALCTHVWRNHTHTRANKKKKVHTKKNTKNNTKKTQRSKTKKKYKKELEL